MHIERIVPRTNAAGRSAGGRPRAGFTLVELAIALAVAALIAAFAVPSYRRQIARGHRLGAVTALYRAAHELAARSHFEPPGRELWLGNVPEQGAPVYRLAVRAAPDDGGYVLSATPVGQGPMHDDRCGTYLLSADGARRNRSPGATGTGEVRDGCWTMR
ncbi:type IV pilin protein [Burkholderia glumae]|uniref:type IV pilin protein n=1 Tax=Burkholderia glumae TaxID=337 RepID=UPI002151DA3E|nr:type IV pilin protein [Burkholderia glumae]